METKFLSPPPPKKISLLICVGWQRFVRKAPDNPAKRETLFFFAIGLKIELFQFRLCR